MVVQELDDGKAQDIVVIPLSGKTSLADALIIATGTSMRHLLGLAERVRVKVKENGFPCIVEGKSGADTWVVLDIGSVLVHLFDAEKRKEYALEDLWK